MRTFAILLLAGSTLAAASTAPSGPRSPAAVSALLKAEKSVASASENYKATLLGIRRAEVEELREARSAALKAENLTEANAIDAEIRRVLADMERARNPGPSLDPTESLRQTVVQRRTYTYSILGAGRLPNVRELEFLPGGLFGRGGGGGWEQLWTVKSVSGRLTLVIAGEEGFIELSPLDGGGFQGTAGKGREWIVTLRPLP